MLDIMIQGQRYLAGDGYGYDYVWCMGTPTEEEIVAKFGEYPTAGIYTKIMYEDTGHEEIWFEAFGYTHVYVEPAPL